MALYRTYRPATFADVVGQDHVTDPLGRALDSGRINHAYLFSGPRGCGKTSSARILARSLNCEQGPTSTPCGTCDSCVALAPGGPGNLDVIELDAASHGGVDDTRDLRDRAHYAPSQSRYRVFIIDEAHMVTNQGFNALLKIVEEPPEHLIFVFATTEPEKVLPTIRSRTHHYPFRLLAPPVMRGLLEGICERESVTVEPEVFPLVIRAGGGSPRDSLSILDQLLAGAGGGSARAESGASGGCAVTYDEAMSLLGVTDVALIDDAVDALAAGDGAALFGTVEDVVNAGHDPRRFAVDLLERLRDLILLQAVPEAVERGLVEAPGDQVDKMHAQIDGLGAAMLTRAAETVHTALGEMRGTTSPRLLLEVMCARLLLPETSADDAALLARLERLEAGGAAAAVGSPAPRAAASAPTPEVAAGASAAGTPASSSPVPAPDDDAPLKYTRRSQRAEEPEPAPEPRSSSADDPLGEAVNRDPEPEIPPSEPEVEATEPKIPPSEPEIAATEPELPSTEPGSRYADSAGASSALDHREEHADSAGASSALDHREEHADSAGASSALDHREEPAAAASGLTLEEVQRRFGEVRAVMREHSPVFEAMLSGAFIHQVADSLVTVGHTAEALAARLSQEERAQALRASFSKVFGTEVDVRTIHAQPTAGPAEAGTAPAAASSQPRQTFRRPSRGDSDTSDEVIPEPEEPSPEPRPDEEISDAERDEMVAQAHDDSPSSQVRDPEEVALELLQSELGARVLDESQGN